MAEEASVDSDERADEAWLLGVQRKLYQWSRNNPDELLSRVVELGNRSPQPAMRLAQDCQ